MTNSYVWKKYGKCEHHMDLQVTTDNKKGIVSITYVLFNKKVQRWRMATI